MFEADDKKENEEGREKLRRKKRGASKNDLRRDEAIGTRQKNAAEEMEITLKKFNSNIPLRQNGRKIKD